MRSFQQFLPFLFLQLLLWFSNITEAVKGAPDLKVEKKPIGARVGVELDYGLAKAGAETPIGGRLPSKGKLQNRLVFMSHYKVPGKIDDVKLVKIAMDGYLDMIASARQYSVHKEDVPSVITVFHSGTDLIIASSQKGGTALTYTRDTAVSALVQQCIHPAEKSNDAKCGEMSAAQLWQRLHPGRAISSANIVTVTVISENRNNPLATTKDQLKVWPPCSKDVGGGCDQIIGPGKVIAREVKPEVFVGKTYDGVTYSKAGWVETPMNVLSFIAPIQ